MTDAQNPESARELIRSISKKHGYLATEKFAAISDPNLRREIEEAFLNKDLLIGSSVITLAKNLYSSKARFVFELLQNADDNHYKRARALQQEPFLSFMLYHDRIVVDCNEDGFTEENLTAICSVGASSKTGAQGYIGEKGIGFKSVFMVAWKVHIQSGSLSFSFTHRPGASGMGMISPVWEDATEELASPLTRMTLYLHNEAKEDGIIKDSIHRQFSDIQETFLLFMKNLRQVFVRFHDDSERETSNASYECKYKGLQGELVSNRARLTKTTEIRGETIESTKHFHLQTHQARNLAKNENRVYTDKEHATRAWSTSEIVLAFPLTETDVPIVEPQNLFVFMPVKSVGLNFIVQADFVTDANRQNVVSDSYRNQDLINEIAEAYLQAVRQFCHHPTLRYQWMRYLPKRNQEDRDRLWATLVEKIALRLAETQVVVSHKSSTLGFMSQLHRLVPSNLDENGQPLFDDVSPETMLSRRYEFCDARVLQDYGVPIASWQKFMIWLRHDLGQGSRSRVKSPASSEDWHTRVAEQLTQPFDQSGSANVARELKELAMIPLSDGSWGAVSPSSPIYFPIVDGLEIPPGTHLRLVDKTIVNPARLLLFKHLGVQPATVDLVRRGIINKYSGTTLPVDITIEQSKLQLEFLIKTQDRATPGETGLERLALYTTRKMQIRPRMSNIYLMTNDPYGPWELLRNTDPGPGYGDGAPGLDRNFLHSIYLQGTSDEPKRLEEWSQWLHNKLDVHRILSFEAIGLAAGTLSVEAKYLQEYRPEKFLGALRVWFEDNKRTINVGLIETLRSTKVLTRGGGKVSLRDTYFPTESLERRVERYVEPDAKFPWLWMKPDMAIQEHVPRTWRALLDVLEVGVELDDLEFALAMLRVSLKILQGEDWFGELSRDALERLFGLYQHVCSMFQEHTDHRAGEQEIRDFFRDYSCCPIYVPDISDKELSTWESAADCVWHAPHFMTSKTVISLVWERSLPSGLSFRNLEYFFTKVVGLAKCSHHTYVEELRTLKNKEEVDVDVMRTWYEALNEAQEPLSVSQLNHLKKTFEDEALIYAPSSQGPSWHKVSDCVWSTASRLRGKPSLNDEYEDLHDFFVETLGVKPVDLEMAVNELKEAANEGSSAEVIRESIWTVNSLLKVTSEWPESTQVTKCRIFPVRRPSGEVVCLSKDAQFFVVDREAYRVAFEDHVKLFHFSLAQVAELDLFLRWAKLEDRYLSDCVKEVTSLGGGVPEAVHDSEKQIRNRAHALLRIAIQYGSPRVSKRSVQNDFYELLRNTQILGTDSITADIQIQQDGRTFTARGKANAVYIREDESQLRVYVPRGRKEQTQAFKIKLPRRFLQWMMTNPDTQMREPISDKSVAATEHVFNAFQSMLEETLEEDGIAIIDIENLDETPDDDDDDNVDSTRAVGEDQTVAGHADPVAATRTHELVEQGHDGLGYDEDDEDASNSSLEGVYTPSTVSASSVWRAASASNRPVTVPLRTQPLPTSQTSIHESITPPSVPSDDAQYSSLLDYVVRAARAADFPHWSEEGQAGFDLAGNNRPVHITANTRFERNCKVGAAGELFVFELLSNLGRQHDSLPGFTSDNWKSNVRQLARAHQEYADLEPWCGVETSDIVYSDEEGILTTLLREKGYFENLWVPGMETPNYFIEVKTTTSGCEAPFYMNRSQYALMQNNALETWNGRSLYIIFRICNLGQDNMGLQIYLDPERQRQQGNLVFTGERWSITPGSV